MNPQAINTIGDLRRMIEGYSDDAPILFQVVGAKLGVWSMPLTAFHGADCGFKWDANPLLIQAKHPEIKVLRNFDDVPIDVILASLTRLLGPSAFTCEKADGRSCRLLKGHEGSCRSN